MPRGRRRAGPNDREEEQAPQTLEKQVARELARRLITAKLTPLSCFFGL